MTYEDFEKKVMRVLPVESQTPITQFWFITFNKDYDPESFSQEIEDSEEKRDFLKWITEGHNTVWEKFENNSEKWLKNHSKICKVKFHSTITLAKDYGGKVGSNVIYYYDEIAAGKILREARKICEDGYEIFGCTFGNIKENNK